jgi:hypothetical protein
MGSDNNVRGYGSDGSSFVAVDNTGRGGGGNGGPVVSSTSGGGGAVNQRADAPAQMGLTNAASSKPGEQPPTLDTVTVTASSRTGTNDANGWIPAPNVTWALYYAESAQFIEDRVDRATKPLGRFIGGLMLGPLMGPVNLGQGLYNGDADQTAWGVIEVATGAIPEIEEAAALLPEIQMIREATDPVVGMPVFRVWGGKSGPWGESWTTINPNSIPNLRSAAGLPDVNAGRFVSEGVLKSTEGVTTRGALVIKLGQQGGLPELVIKNAQQKIELQRVSGVNPEY